MGHPLVPCGGCSRHVRAAAAACPFCGAARDVRETPTAEGPMPRMSRAVTFSLGAAILAGSSALLEGCISAQPVYGAPAPPVEDASADAPTDAAADVVPGDGSPGVRYGAPPPHDA